MPTHVSSPDTLGVVRNLPDNHGAATPLDRLAIANHIHPLTSSTNPIASHGHGLHSSTQDWLVAVEVQTVPGPDRFKNAT